VNRRYIITGIIGLILADLAIMSWVLSRNNTSLILWVFIFALGSLVPLASLIGEATERLIPFLGDVSSGLLNATLSNVPELAIGIFLLIHAREFASSPAVASSDLDVIRGLLVGSVINNILLTLGVAVFIGAMRHGRLRFDAGRAAGYASMLALAVVGLALPNLATAFATQRGADLAHAQVVVSVLVSIILMGTYIVYIGTEIFGWGNRSESALATSGEDSAEGEKASERVGHEQGGHERPSEAPGHIPQHKLMRELEEAEEHLREDLERREHLEMRKRFPSRFRLAIIGLAAVTAVTVVVAFVLVNVTDQVVATTALTPLSVGLIIFPIVCNLGEAAGAIQSAWHRNMETAMSVGAGSSVQIPLFVTPLLVFISLAIAATGTGSILTLLFPPAELIVVGLVAFMYALVNLDGETTWLEGLQLIALYSMVAITAFVLPGR
jgi:Ca2+:H+ antiporter